MTVLGFGVVGTANIATEKVIPAINRSERCRVLAIGSREPATATAAATRLGIPQALSYHDLVEAPGIDAVYIPLPNSMHAEWAVTAMRAGKHVLCEKPLAPDLGEVQWIVETAETAGTIVMEAFMYRTHPSWVATVDRVRTGAIGEPTAVQSWFSYYNDDPANIRNIAMQGGGALLDIGCYCVSLSRWLFDGEPEVVEARMKIDPATGTDVVTSAVLDFGGRHAGFTCSTRSAADQRVHIYGTEGRIEIPIPFNIPPDVPTEVHLYGAHDAPGSAPAEILTFPAADPYTTQADAFAAAVLDGAPVPVTLQDSVANMAVIEAIRAAAS